MGDISFGSTVAMLKNAMHGAGEAHGVIANNIANANTPNFHRTEVTFQESLAASLGTSGDSDSDDLALLTSDDRQIPIGGARSPQPFSVTKTIDDTDQQRVDGSNVDIDQEMAKLSINSGYAQSMSTMLTQQYGRLRRAITDQLT
jgi:flagellar basal-body rod protein FlgB